MAVIEKGGMTRREALVGLGALTLAGACAEVGGNNPAVEGAHDTAAGGDTTIADYAWK